MQLNMQQITGFSSPIYHERERLNTRKSRDRGENFMPTYYLLWPLAFAVAVLLVVSFATGGLMFALGRRFIEEFTRPGVTVSEDAPTWGGWKFPDFVAEPPHAMQRAVTFCAADGTILRGEFWAQDHTARTIIISHGFHLPCVNFRSVAALEYSHGANIMLFDYRGHGESTLRPTTCGNAEVIDLQAAIEVAASQPETRIGNIYIHGFSMGAAVALLMPPHHAVAGIVADSPYARLDEMIHRIIGQIIDDETSHWRGPARIVRAFLPQVVRLTYTGGRIMFKARYHYPLTARPDRTIVRQAREENTPVAPPILLIHAEHDPLISLRNAHRLDTVARAAGRPIEVYYTPSHVHCGSYGYDPHRYIELLQQFVENTQRNIIGEHQALGGVVG
jgi:uncharacterized protein